MTTYNPISAAGAAWETDYGALRLSYDRSALDQAIRAFIRTEMPDEITGADEETVYMLISIAFVKLTQRGAIGPIRPLSTEGERQLAELKANFNVVPGDLRPKAAVLSFVEQVAKDFNEHVVPMTEIKKRRKDPAYEQAYVEALEQGLIV
jgi:hypothetical protein